MVTHKYELAFKDMFDGWIDCHFYEDNLDIIKAECNKRNENLNASNKNCGEHYGIFERTEQGWRKIYGNAL